MKNPFKSIWNKLRRFFLFRKLVLSFFAVSLVSVLFICSVILAIYEKSAKREMEYMASLQLNRANGAVTQIVSSVSPVMSSVLSLSYTETFFYSGQINRVNEQNVLIHLRQLQNSYELINNISLVNLSNERFLGTQGIVSGYLPEILEEPELGNAFGMKYYKRSTPRNINIEPASVESVMTFVLFPRGLYTQSAVVVDIREAYLEQALRANTSGEWNEIMLVAENGLVLAGDNVYASREELAGLISRKPGSYVEQLEDQKTFLSFQESDMPGCYLVLAMPYKRLIPFADSLRQGLFLAVLGFVVLIVLFSGILVNRIYHPLNDLIKHQKLFTGREPVETQRNVDELKLLYGTMMDHVQKLSLLESYRDDTVPMLGKSWLWSLLRGDGEAVEQTARFTRFNPADFTDRSFCVAVISIDGYAAYCEKNDEGERRLHDFAMSNVLDELMGQYLMECTVRMDDNLLAVAFSFSENEIPQDVVLALREFQACMLRFFSLSLTVGIGKVKNTWRELSQSYREAQRALSFKFYTGPSSFLISGEQENDRSPAYPGKAERKLREAVQLKNTEQTVKATDAFFSAIRCFDREHIQTYAERCVYAVESLTAQDGPALWQAHEQIKKGISEAENLGSLQRLLEDYFRELLAHMSERGRGMETENNGPVQIAKEYVDEHYDDMSLSVEFLASLAGLSPAYFGKQFAQFMGMSCLDYITDVRISHAAELLTTTELTAADISRRAGINSTNYFYTLFKKKYGLTPIQYRRKYRENGRVK